MQKNEQVFSLEIWGVRLISLLVALAGFINVLSGIFPAMHWRYKVINNIFPLTLIQGARIIVVLAGFFLIILSYNLWRHKQLARILAIILLLLSVASHLVKGLDFEEGAYLLLLAFGLWQMKPYFHARSDPPSIRQGFLIFLFSILFTFAYGIIGFFVLDHHYRHNYSIWEAANQTFRLLTGSSQILPVTRFGEFFISSIYVIATTTLLYALYKIFLPVFINPATTADRKRAQKIIVKYGETVLARFALFEDKSYFFDNETVIAYRRQGRNAIALGDPIGPTIFAKKTIIDFKNLCKKNDWRPIFYQTKNEQIYQKLGFSSLAIGKEAIVDLEKFNLDGHENKKLRSACNRLQKLGFKVKVIKAPFSNNTMARLREISDAWLYARKGKEESFSLGSFDDEYIKDSQVAALFTPQEEICAFANLVSEYQKNEIAVDMMRFIDIGENGMMEYLFVNVFGWAKEQGYDSFNLGLSPLMTKNRDRIGEKALDFAYENLNHWHNFQGLYKFKAKFNPDWQTRYLIYPTGTNLVSVFYSLVKLHR